MGAHEEFLKLCAAATAGEVSDEEQDRLQMHLAGCPDCRQAMSEFDAASGIAVAALSSDLATEARNADDSFSVERAEAALFKRLDGEAAKRTKANHEKNDVSKPGQRFSYRPSQVRWREIWMPFAAAVLLAAALGITAYKAGIRRATNVDIQSSRGKESAPSLEEETSDAGHERAELMAKLEESAKAIQVLKRQLSEETKAVDALRAKQGGESESSAKSQNSEEKRNNAGTGREDELAAAQKRLVELQQALDAAVAERADATNRASVLEARVTELSQLMKERERALDEKEMEFAKQRELLEHDRDIRELMGARDLYIAEIHDIVGSGQTTKPYGRIFFTKGKRLVFYAYDLDGQPGVRDASTFQAWGRRGPDKQQALSLGVFYEDNVSKKRWVLKADDPKTLDDIDAVFVTVEPNGGSHHPSGKQLLFAYLRVSPNHP